MKIKALIDTVYTFIKNPKIEPLSLLTEIKIFEFPAVKDFKFETLISICDKVFKLAKNPTKSLANKEYIKEIECLANEVYKLKYSFFLGFLNICKRLSRANKNNSCLSSKCGLSDFKFSFINC